MSDELVQLLIDQIGTLAEGVQAVLEHQQQLANKLDEQARSLNAMAIAMGLHVRVGIEDNLWARKGERMTSVQQIEKMVKLSRELYRDVATADDARRIYKLGERYRSTDETLASIGFAPNRKAGERGIPGRTAR